MKNRQGILVVWGITRAGRGGEAAERSNVHAQNAVGNRVGVIEKCYPGQERHAAGWVGMCRGSIGACDEVRTSARLMGRGRE